MLSSEIGKIIGRGRNVYVVGIKGAGVAGLAQILKAKGFEITGSDTKDRFFTDAILKRARIPYFEGFSRDNVVNAFSRHRPIRANGPMRKINWALVSNAYLMDPVTNPEILELRRQKIPILSYPEALSHFFNESFGIAIAGTHGKTSVASALAFILDHAGLNPNALIGGEVLNWNSNAIVSAPSVASAKEGQKNIFVLEADEYKDAFLNYRPDIAVVLNTDWDHPDYFKSHADYKKSFKKFTQSVKPGGKVFTAKDFAKTPGKIETPLIGEHNQFNLRAAWIVARYLGVPERTIRDALKKFKGTRRRLETVGRLGTSILIDDYAHNPQKVAASLQALKKHYPKKKIIVVFQPHTYSRTEAFLGDFAKVLLLADETHLLDIYASAREVKGTVTSDDIVLEVQRLGKNAVNLRTVENAAEFFKKNPPKNAVLAAMGAGNVGDLAHILAREK
ncbi:MAG: hypothetical protein A2846_04505 [Candidatus Doudnabacteria bacterium RIFCSPHIGHO2_01_FULL_49_9]|uniref:UDP-N-acetylmuramate--L-alanine ligase n=1 Tax=Candidatus Doudnabacteria bacterium RIFCSPHIGHO2_01_FULL_49_9 TaxID=1817827 RepID=A0A1F5P3P1_9BACT|nr:MAG: hypothetical protein A2846_04505 [Candidatus Doudnabacteria bacterium RIFCSPHIGHO2_01_FULL_49_9]